MRSACSQLASIDYRVYAKLSLAVTIDRNLKGLQRAIDAPVFDGSGGDGKRLQALSIAASLVEHGWVYRALQPFLISANRVY